jgi:hypothetical protein
VSIYASVWEIHGCLGGIDPRFLVPVRGLRRGRTVRGVLSLSRVRRVLEHETFDQLLGVIFVATGLRTVYVARCDSPCG